MSVVSSIAKDLHFLSERIGYCMNHLRSSRKDLSHVSSIEENNYIVLGIIRCVGEFYPACFSSSCDQDLCLHDDRASKLLRDLSCFLRIRCKIARGDVEAVF